MGIETLAAISLGATVLGGVTQAAGSMMSGDAKASMYNYRSQVGRNMADYERQVGDFKVQQQGMKTGQQLGTQRAIQGASGIDVNSGSFQDVRASTAALGRLDELMIRSNSDKAAEGLEQEALMDSISAKNARREGQLGAVTSLLGAAASVGPKWRSMQREGAI